MKVRLSVQILLLAVLPLFLIALVVYSADYPKQPITIEVEGAKMAPVAFLHESHVEKEKIACNVCHHKDKDAQNPKACTTCHGAKEVKGGAPAAKDAFHTICQDCHKKAAAKSVTAPTKCNECHKK